MSKELLAFNLEEALKNPERVVYRNGEKPLEWHWLKNADQNGDCIVNVDSSLDINTNRINGSFDKLLGSRYDLMLLPINEKRYWVNVYKDSKLNDLLCCSQVVFDSEDSAKYGVDLTRPFIKTITFTV